MSAIQQKRLKALNANFKKTKDVRESHLDFLMDNVDMGIWYVRIRDLLGDNDEFKGGEYIVQMIAPERYPFDPPQFFFFTPNDVYDIKKKVCISIGEFHTDNYAAAQGGMTGFARMLINGLITWKDLGSGISLLNPRYVTASKEVKDKMLPELVSKKQEVARNSIDFNERNYLDLVRRFNALSWNVMKKGLLELYPTLQDEINFYIP